MIIDALENAETYRGLGAGFQQAFDWLRGNDLASLAAGSHEIDGQAVYALVQDNTLRPDADAAWECHRRYADIQYLVSGTERMGAALLSAADRAGADYNADKDFAKLSPREGAYFILGPGQFALFLPHDAHRPNLRIKPDGADAERVKKIVIKVRVG